jgi:hypothetical protein
MPVVHAQPDLVQPDLDITFTIKSLPFDEDYQPTGSTRITTNFANLARGENRRDNLRNALRMIDNRFNALAHWDNPEGDRYAVELDIISVEMKFDGKSGSDAFPIIEILKTGILDTKTGMLIDGIVGNNVSSYVRDYDFSILLPEHNRGKSSFSTPDDFGTLHGKLFQHFLRSAAYSDHFAKPPVICLSVSTSKTYHRTDNHHPILGIEYRQSEFSPPTTISPRWACRCAISCPGEVAHRWPSISPAICRATTPTSN